MASLATNLRKFAFISLTSPLNCTHGVCKWTASALIQPRTRKIPARGM